MIKALLKGESTSDLPFAPGAAAIDNYVFVSYKYLIENTFSISEFSETSFIEKYLMPIIRPIFLANSKSNLLFSLVDGRLKQNNTKLDIMLGYKVSNKDAWLFFIEVKRPDTDSKYQLEDDFTKLMKQLKVSLDYQIQLRIKNRLSFGVLVEGYDCSLYQMSLEEDGVYLPVHIISFQLVKDLFTLLNIATAVEAFEYVKRYLDGFEDSFSNRAKHNSETLASFKKDSFLTKIVK